MLVAAILALAFASISLIAWTLLSGGSAAYEARSANLAAGVETKLRGLFVFADTRRLVLLYAATLLGLPLALSAVGTPLPIVGATFALLLAAPRALLRRLALRRRLTIERELPDALGQIAGSMRAGATFTGALQSLVDEHRGPLGQEFGLLLREVRVGARLEEALDNLGERVQSEEMDLLIAAALIAQEIGGNLADILARLSETLRRKLEMEGKVRSLTAQGVLQGRVVTALPFGLLGILLLIEPAATRPMLTSLLGWCFLGVMVVLQTLGALLIRRIVRIEI